MTYDLTVHPFEAFATLDSIERRAARSPDEPAAPLLHLACSVLYSTYRGWEDEHVSLRARLDELAATLAAADTSAARGMQNMMILLDGLDAWLAGDARSAYDILRRFEPQPGPNVPFLWYARILIEADRPDEAIPYLRAQRSDPLSHLYLGKAYEALGRDAEARDVYEFFLSYWGDADPEL